MQDLESRFEDPTALAGHPGDPELNRMAPHRQAGFRILAVALMVGLIAVPGRAADEVRDLSLYRYLFVVNTSSAMARQKDVAIDTVHRLILGGINGRIQTGDVLGVWTFSDTLVTNAFSPQMWVPERSREIANAAYRFLRDQKLSKKAQTEGVVAAIRGTAAASGSLTVFLICDGTTPVTGTPFDEPINAIFTNHSAAMSKSGKPFVVTMVASDGELAAQSVSPGGGKIYIPSVKKPASTKTPSREPEATPEVKTAEARPPVQPVETPVAPTVVTNGPPKSLSVEEIAAELARQTVLRSSNSTAAVPAPIATAPPDSAPPGTDPVKPGAVETASPAARDPVATAVTPPAQTPESPAPVSALNPASHKPAEAAVMGNRKATESAAPTTVLVPPSDPTTESVEPEASPAQSPQQTALVLPVQSDSRFYLLVAVALFLSGLVLGWLLFRNGRHRPSPSLISRSMDQDQK